MWICEVNWLQSITEIGNTPPHYITELVQFSPNLYFAKFGISATGRILNLAVWGVFFLLDPFTDCTKFSMYSVYTVGSTRSDPELVSNYEEERESRSGRTSTALRETTR